MPKKNNILLIIVLISTNYIYSQTVEGGFNTTVAGSTFEVTIFANMQSGSGTAGVLTLEFTFNNNGMSFVGTPSKGTDYTLYGDFDSYTTQNITRPSSNKVRISLLTTGSPSEVPLSTSPTNIITVYFNISDDSQTSNLVWTEHSIAPEFLQSNYTNGTWSDSNDPLPVELTTFTAVSKERSVELRWDPLCLY